MCRGQGPVVVRCVVDSEMTKGSIYASDLRCVCLPHENSTSPGYHIRSRLTLVHTVFNTPLDDGED